MEYLLLCNFHLTSTQLWHRSAIKMWRKVIPRHLLRYSKAHSVSKKPPDSASTLSWAQSWLGGQESNWYNQVLVLMEIEESYYFAFYKLLKKIVFFALKIIMMTAAKF